MIDLFTRRKDLASCPWIKQCSNGKLRTSTLVNYGTLRSTTDFPSAHSNVNIVEIFDLLEFLVMLLFSILCSHPKIIYRKLQDYENIHGGYYFLTTQKNLWKKFLSICTFNFAKTYLNGYFPMKLPLVTCKKEQYTSARTSKINIL